MDPRGHGVACCVPAYLYKLPSGSLTMLLGADTAAACCFCAAFFLRLAALPATTHSSSMHHMVPQLAPTHRPSLVPHPTSMHLDVTALLQS